MMARAIAWMLAALWLSITPAHAELPGRVIAVCVAPVRAGDTPAAMLTAPRRFTCDRAQASYGSGDFWVRSATMPAGVGGPVAVRFLGSWQDSIALWARRADGSVTRITLDDRAIARHIHIGAVIEIDVPGHAAAVDRMLWRVDGAANLSGVLNAVTVATPAEAARADLIVAAIYAAFAGLCFAMLTYNLALWAALRDRAQLAYCAMTCSLLAYAVTSSGALAWLLPALGNNDRLRVKYVVLGIMAASAVTFARWFFGKRVFGGVLDRVAIAIAIGLLATSVIVALFVSAAVRPLLTAYTFALLSLVGIVVPVLWRTWRQRDGQSGLLAIAWGVPVLLASLRLASNIRLIGWSLWLENSTLLSMALEAMLASLAIAYRTRLLSDERDEAREGEQAARLLADLDPLTGLLNRRAFLRDAVGREGEQMLFLADIDHFKGVNERIGHDGGDDVLRAVARALRRGLPDEALLARIGGEEFALVMPADLALAPATLLAQVRDTAMPFDITVTVSIGVCRGPLTGDDDWKRLYRNADRAMFEAKASGRDRARTAPITIRAV